MRAPPAWLFALTILCTLLPTWVHAEEVFPKEQLLFYSLVVGRHYPIGADAQGALQFKKRIGDSEDLLLKTRFWSLGVVGTWNPAEWSVGAAAEVEPLAVFQLRASYERRGFYGSYGEVLSWREPPPDLSDAALEAAGGRAQNYRTHRDTWKLEPKLRALWRPIGLQNVTTLQWGRLNARPGDTVYYDAGSDLLLPVQGLTLNNQLSAVYLAGPWVAGALYEFAAPLALGPSYQVHRAGPLLAYTFFERAGAWINKPTVFATSLFGFKHPSRTGFPPTTIVGVSTETDFLALR
jgi:hypothetical protein